jgi:hypothetical protein
MLRLGAMNANASPHSRLVDPLELIRLRARNIAPPMPTIDRS